MFQWLIILYILFVIVSAILNTAKEVKNKREIIIKKAEIPKEEEIKKEVPKEILLPKKTVEKKEKIEEKVKKEKKIEETYIEKSLKNNLPEIIALIEIIGPPKAYQNWTVPYRKKN